jgi:maltooligosyltrehalose trehalohydrolase
MILMSNFILGAHYLGGGQCAFTLWASLLKQAVVHLVAPDDRLIPMIRDVRGYWHATVANVEPARFIFLPAGWRN